MSNPELLSEEDKIIKWGEFVYALPISALVILGFVLIQKAGLANFINSSDVSYGTAFVIGLIASVSTCLAVVGGIVLSLSANSAKRGGTWRPQVLFHIGRLVGFFVLGGIIGLIGSTFHFSIIANIVLGIIVGIVMLILGINLLDVFSPIRKFQVRLPKCFSRYVLNISERNYYFTPALFGAGTFFLPCGFTQSMQVYVLTAGGFIEGAITMFVFALGTFPVLALLSFGSLNIANSSWRGTFFKIAGILVIALALLNITNSLVVAGVIAPIFNL
ncbi:MAG: sulfite exporter TauE/SafE family protein [Candidatus Paceibacterota bacterium]|jgi:sulfite exporter TauE/SafE